jgi:predicted PurR-regulated permease PerM
MSALSSPHPTVPGWLAFVAAAGWRVLSVVGLGVVLFAAGVYLLSVTLSVLVAILVAAAASPIVIRLRAGGRSRTGAAGLASVAAIGIVVAGLLVIALTFVPALASIVTSVQNGLADLADVAATAGLDPRAVEAITNLSSAIDDWLQQGLRTIVAGAAFWATVGILAAFLTFFFLQDGDGGWRWCIQAAKGSQRDLLTAAGTSALVRSGGYLRRTAVRSAIDAIALLVVLVVLDIQPAGALAVLMLIGGFVPYVGRLAVGTVVVLVALATAGAGVAALLALGLVIAAVAEQILLVRRLPGCPSGLHPIAVLVAVPVGAQLGGIAGLIFVVPVAVMVVTVGAAVRTVLDEAAGPGPRVAALPGVPFWLDRAAQWSWRLLVAFGLGAAAIVIVAQLSGLVLALVIAAVLAASLVPLTKLLLGRGWSRGTAALAAITGGSVAVGAILLVTVLGLASGIAAIAAETEGGGGKISDALGGQADWIAEVIGEFSVAIVAVGAQITAAAVSLAAVCLIGLLLSFYALRDGSSVWHLAAGRLSAGRRAELEGAGERAVGVLGGYMVGTAVISAVSAGSQWLIMTILGLPLALPLAVFAFFLGFIPYIGGFIATLAAFLVAVAVGSTTDIIVMGIFTLVFNIITGSFIAPVVYGRVASIHPAVVLVAIPAGSTLAGVLGMFLAVPVIGIVAVTWRSALRLLDPRAGGPDGPDDVPAQRDDVPVVPAPAAAGDLVPDPGSQVAPAS